MTGAIPREAALRPHPQSGDGSVRALTAGIELDAQGDPGAGVTAVCRYRLRGDFARICVPRASGDADGGRRLDGLWHHTCFEAFLAVPDDAVYYEFNFSPAGDWAAYRFDGYRRGMSPAPLAHPPRLVVQSGDGELALTARVPLAGLPPLAGARTVRVALAAVIEERGGWRGYWALRHAPGAPDFHHPQAYALEREAREERDAP